MQSKHGATGMDAIETTKRMKSIKKKTKEWCSNQSNKGCTEQCDGCWQMIQGFGCEQHNMELAYEAGANYVLEQIEQLIYEKQAEGKLSLFDLTHLIDKLKEK